MSIQLGFFRSFSSYFSLFGPCAVCIVSWFCNQSSSALFLCSLGVAVSMHWHNLQFWYISPPLLFLTPTVSLHRPWDLKPHAWSLVCLFSGQFLEVLPSFTSEMTPRILQELQPRRLSFSWDFCYKVWFRVVFSFSWDNLFNFSFSRNMFDSVWFQYSQVLVGFHLLRAF